jgi:hypothetical protein
MRSVIADTKCLAKDQKGVGVIESIDETRYDGFLYL